MPKIKQKHCKSCRTDVYNKLVKSKQTDVVDFITTDCEELVELTNVSYREIIALRGILLAEFSAFPQDAEMILNEVMDTLAILPTGCKALDDLLCGGIYTAEVTEICGPIASGKSQLSMHLAFNVARETEQEVIYLDSGGSFDWARLRGIITHTRTPMEEAERTCSRITWTHVPDVYSLLRELEAIKERLLTQEGGAKLVIIDSFAALVSHMLGVGQSEGYGLLNQVVRILKPFAVEYSLAVLVINNTVEWKACTRPALCRSWIPVPATRILLKKSSILKRLDREQALVDYRDGDENRETELTEREQALGIKPVGGGIIEAVLVKSAKHPTGLTAKLRITEYGLQGLEEQARGIT